MIRLSQRQQQLASCIDHTLLKADATPAAITHLCEEARQYGFYSVCVNPFYTALANKLLIGTTVRVCTVIGFPLGATFTEVKVNEAREALRNGAIELDMVINIGALLGGDTAAVQYDIESVVNSAHKGNALVKVIIETALLDEDQKITACDLVTNAGADFIKTSTGFARSGATVEDVELLRRYVGPNVRIKASGGIRDIDTALDLLDAGADRIGTSSGVALLQAVEELEEE